MSLRILLTGFIQDVELEHTELVADYDVIDTIKSNDWNWRLRTHFRQTIARLVENMVLISVTRSIKFDEDSSDLNEVQLYTQVAEEIGLFETGEDYPEPIRDKILMFRLKILHLTRMDLEEVFEIRSIDEEAIPTIPEIWLELCERVQNRLIALQKIVKNS